MVERIHSKKYKIDKRHTRFDMTILVFVIVRCL